MNSNSSSETQKDIAAKKSGLRENAEAILVAIVLALFIRTFIIQAFKIPSGSMLETLQIGDHILVNKFIYGVKLPFSNKTIIPFKSPQRGDIIVFEFPEDPDKDFIKRVIGLPGDVIEIQAKKVYVNRQPLDLPQAIFKDDDHIMPAAKSPRDNYGPITIKPDSLFVMGDNRDQSYDSRFWGVVNLKAVKGKAFIIYWSWDSQNFGVRWKRLAKMLY